MSATEKDVNLLALGTYRYELFFATLRRLCHDNHTTLNATRAVRHVIVKEFLDIANDVCEHHRKCPSEFFQIIKGPILISMDR